MGVHEAALHDTEFALAHRATTEVRPTVFEHITLARAQLALGATEDALGTGQRILELAGELRSTRVRDRMVPLLQDTDASTASDVRDLGAALGAIG